MKENKIELNEKELSAVTGGDNGDTNKELGADGTINYMYNIGDVVEVYNTDFHITTKRAVIIDRYPQRLIGHYQDKEPVAVYEVQYDGGGTDTVIADDIERKK